MGLNTQSLLMGKSIFGKLNYKRIISMSSNQFSGRQAPEGTTRLADDKESPPTPPTQSTVVSSPTHVPGSYRMLQKYGYISLDNK